VHITSDIVAETDPSISKHLPLGGINDLWYKSFQAMLKWVKECGAACDGL
jgi:hypothetical protein